ncbi:MAG: stalk domain-containing protein [Clostridia bacterium]|nr:stalk domain-containing protein [Clostridia bacterium]
MSIKKNTIASLFLAMALFFGIIPLYASGDVCQNDATGKKYSAIKDAMYEANGKTITLLSDAYLPAGNLGTNGYILKGNGHKLILEGDVTLLSEKGAVFQDITIDLSGFHFAVTENSGDSVITLGKGATVENGSGTNGGAFLVNAGAEVIMEDGAVVRNSVAAKGSGGGFFLNGGTLIMKGGTIENCSSINRGGGVLVNETGTLKLSGSAKIINNKSTSGQRGPVNNVEVRDADGFILSGAFTGSAGLRYDEGGEGVPCGIIEGNDSGADQILWDIDNSLVGSVSGTNLVITKGGSANSSGTSTSSSENSGTASGKTEIVPGGDVCYIGNDPESGIKYSDLKTALYAANGKTVHLLKNAYLPAGNLGTNGYVIDGTNPGGENFRLLAEGDVTLLNDKGATFTNVTVDLNSHHINVSTTGSPCKVILKEGAVFENGSGTNGGAFLVNAGNEVIMEEGAIVRNSVAAKGSGGGFFLNGGTLTMNGGSIENCSSINRGGGIIVNETGTLILTGNSKVVNNKSTSEQRGPVNNIEVRDGDGLILKGAFTGTAGISYDEGTVGVAIGIAEGGASGAEKLIFDKDNTVKGNIADGKIVLTKGDGTPTPVGNGKPLCYIGTNKGKTYTNLSEAIKASKGETVYLMGDMSLNTGGSSYSAIIANIDGGGYKIKAESEIKLIYGSHLKFTNATIDLNNKNHFVLQYTGKLTLGKGAIVENGKASNGGAVLIYPEGEMYMEEGSQVRNNTCDGGGGGIRVHGGLLVMKGGTVIGNTSNSGSGIGVSENGKLVLSGNAKVEGNINKAGKEENIRLDSKDYLILNGEFAGSAGVTMATDAKEGSAFGLANGAVKGARKLYLDSDKSLSGSVSGNELVFAKTASAKDSGTGEAIYTEPDGISYVDKKDWKVEINSGNPVNWPRLIDGSLVTYWHSGYTVENNAIVAKDDPPFNIDITLPEETVISGFGFANRPDGGAGKVAHLKFFVEENGEFKEAGDYKVGQINGLRREFFTCNIKTKKVRVQILDGMGGYGSLAEIELISENKNLKTAKDYEDFLKITKEDGLYKIDKSKASAYYEGEVWGGRIIQNVIDGEDTCFQNQPKTGELEILIDLGASYNLEAISHQPRLDDSPGYWYNYTIYASNDGENYEEVKKNFLRDFSYDIVFDHFDETVTARYFKFAIHRGYNGIMSCTEIDFYESYEEQTRRIEESREIYKLVIGDKNITHKNGTVTLDTAPYIENGTTFIPLRGLLELMGAEIAWSDREQGITITKDDTKIYLQIRYETVKVTTPTYGEVRYNLLAEPRITDNRTFVPIRFISEQLGYNVSWDGETKTVTITN